MNLNQRIAKLQMAYGKLADARQRRQEMDRSGQENLAKIKAHPEGMAILNRLLELVPNMEPTAILFNPEACDLSVRLWEIITTGDYDRFPCPATA